MVDIMQLYSNNNIKLQYIPDRCTDSGQQMDVGTFGPVKIQVYTEFKEHAAGVVESHRKLIVKYEEFIKGWRHLSKQSVIDSWYKAGLR